MKADTFARLVVLDRCGPSIPGKKRRTLERFAGSDRSITGLLWLAFRPLRRLAAAATEGARYGARAGATPEQGAGRARELISRSLSSRFADGVSASVRR